MVKLGLTSQAILFILIGFTLGATVAFAHAKGEREGMTTVLLGASPLGLSEQKI